jgi:tRNA uridine 5-carboxymethylaminomethyl modification enzyme
VRDLCARVPALADQTFAPAVLEAVEVQAKYAGYLDREQRLIDRYQQLESRAIPDAFDYTAIPDLRFEAREKLSRFRPRSLGQSGRHCHAYTLCGGLPSRAEPHVASRLRFNVR